MNVPTKMTRLDHVRSQRRLREPLSSPDPVAFRPRAWSNQPHRPLLPLSVASQDAPLALARLLHQPLSPTDDTNAGEKVFFDGRQA